MLKPYRAWSGATTVLAVTVALVVLDLTDRSVHSYWSRHSFAASVLSGLLVLLLTVLVVDRVIRIRQLRNQSQAIAAQAAVIVAQANRAVDVITRKPLTDDDRDEASDELRTYTQMLLTSAPLLIGSKVPRTFLETAQRVAAQLFQALRDVGDQRSEPANRRLDGAMEQLRASAAPLLGALNRAQLNAVRSDDADSSDETD